MSRSSIYKQFSKKLIFATTIFIVVLSFMFYGFTKATIYEEISDDLLKDAKLIATAQKNLHERKEELKVLVNDDTTIEIVTLKNIPRISFKKFTSYRN